MSEQNCPLPLSYQHIVMAHGGGGRLMQQLLDDLIQPAFDNPLLKQKLDSAVLEIQAGKISFTTDSYVIKPLFFPGGDIGKLAVCGTLNDLAMSGARPLYLSCSLIIEEGFAIADLQKILASMQQTAAQAGVAIVTGDTKVVNKGQADGVYINTSGIGVIDSSIKINPQAVKTGDCILVNSDLGRHGMAVMLERDNLQFAHPLQSDCADLSGLVGELLAENIEIHCLRDLTRGGLAAALIEIAASAGLHFEINEAAIPINEHVQSACEVLGFDPLTIANEGAMALFVPESGVDDAFKVLSRHPLGKSARLIGKVVEKDQHGLVTLKNALGVSRVLDLFSGEQFPRIC